MTQPLGETLARPSLPLEVVRGMGELTLKLSVLEEGGGQPEVFNTVQGEGRHIGQPTAFMRLSECNQHCNFCDTAFTWAFTPRLAEFHDDKKVYDKEQWQVQKPVSEMVNLVYATNPNSVVVTGGEPMMQQRAIANFADGIREVNPDYHIEVETAGTIPPTQAMAERVSHFNVSPKLPSSGNDPRTALKPAVLRKFAELPNADFKFVITDDADMEHVLRVVEESGMPANRVYLMPEGRNKEELARYGDKVAQLAVKHGFNLTTRLHIMLWGDKKNV